MPRKSLRIDRYERGMVDDPDPKNLHLGEMKELINVDISSYGKISMLGKFSSDTNLTSSVVQVAKDITPGYGLLTFSHDRTSTGGLADTNYIAIAGKTTDNNKKTLELMEADGTSVLTVDLTTNDTSAFKPVFYYIDGALRICDGNLNSTKPLSKWVGFVKRTHFDGNGAGREVNYSSWHSDNATLTAPSVGIVSGGIGFSTNRGVLRSVCSSGGASELAISTGNFQYDWNDISTEITNHIAISETDGQARDILSVTNGAELITSDLSGTWSGDTYSIWPTSGNGVNVSCTIYTSTQTNGANGAFTSGTYEMAASFLYDDVEQESKLKKLAGFVTLSTDVGTAPYALHTRVHITSDWNPRVKAVRIYSGKREDGRFGSTSANKVETWQHLCDLDMEKGIKLDFASDDYADWTNLNSSGTTAVPTNKYQFSETIINSLSPDTYESLSGYLQQDTSLSVRYKCATISNRIAYVGNALSLTASSNEGVMQSDSIFKSLPNKFDSFPSSLRLDVAKQDGENIVQLENYADRILQFKERTVYIINTAQDIEFLESQHDNLGIDNPYQVTRTEYGVMWFNQRGVYLYDGERVRDLFLDPNDFGRRTVNLSDWRSFLGNSPQIGYDAKEKKAFIWADSTGASSSISVRCYDFNVLGWSELEGGVDNFVSTQEYTNFAQDQDGTARVFSGGVGATGDQEFMTWQPGTTKHSTKVFAETREYDFDMPGIKKNLYVVYVTHKNSGTGISVKYRVGQTTSLFTLDTSAGATVLPNSTSFVTTRLTPTNSTDAQNIQSVSLVVESAGLSDAEVPENFELKDMEIIYRDKTKR